MNDGDSLIVITVNGVVMAQAVIDRQTTEMALSQGISALPAALRAIADELENGRRR